MEQNGIVKKMGFFTPDVLYFNVSTEFVSAMLKLMKTLTDDYYGNPVNLAARKATTAPPYKIVNHTGHTFTYWLADEVIHPSIYRFYRLIG
jgi:hypothetical protein